MLKYYSPDSHFQIVSTISLEYGLPYLLNFLLKNVYKGMRRILSSKRPHITYKANLKDVEE